MSSFSSNPIKAAAAQWVARRDGGLSRSETVELETWLTSDPRHRAALERCDSTWGALERPYQSGAADDLIVAVELRVRRQRRQRMSAAAAGLAVLLAVGVTWRTTTPTASPLAKHASSRTAVVILPLHRLLPDGSRVELNGGAEIAVDFGGPFRRVVLQKGEVHFQVVKDAMRPFVVSVDDVEVRAVGTAFAVQRRASKVEVLVTEGRVEVDRQGENASVAGTPAAQGPEAPRTIATLDAGDRTMVSLSPTDDARPEVETLPVAELSQRLAWRAPQLEFTGTPLSEAVTLLNEQSTRAAVVGQRAPRYIIDDPEIAPMRVSGLFRVDTTDSFVRLLKQGFGIDAATREDSGEIVLRKAR
jgi:transmembrane sensor